MLLIFALFTILTVMGALSPLLTFLALFQQKEWRMDRFVEHLQREGVFAQLWGTVRPLLALLILLTDLAGFWMLSQATTQDQLMHRVFLLFVAHGFWLCVWAGAAALQWILRKQRTPVWTSKAVMIGALSILLLLVLSYLITPYLIVAGIIFLLQPVLVCAAWLILLPLDRFLKNREFLRAAAVRDTWTGATVIGIAGSVGKTTTKELLTHLLQDLHPIATPAHVNTEMGVAQWMIAQNAQQDTRATQPVIVEMGAYKKGEIALMCEFVKPTIGVMTALGSDHLALFGSEEAIIEANAELLQALPENGHAFLYADNDATRSLADLTACDVTLAGEHESAQVRTEHTEQTDGGLRLTLTGERVVVSLHGLHNSGNILLAVAVARHLGISNARIATLLQSFHPLAHTFHVRTEGGVLLVDDTYNSSRLSIRAALDWARERSERPRVLLLSGLLETGAEEDRFMEELGLLGKECVERVLFLSKSGADAFAKGYGKPVEILSSHSVRLEKNALLLCVGRMPLSSIQRLLPVIHPS